MGENPAGLFLRLNKPSGAYGGGDIPQSVPQLSHIASIFDWIQDLQSTLQKGTGLMGSVPVDKGPTRVFSGVGE